MNKMALTLLVTLSINIFQVSTVSAYRRDAIDALRSENISGASSNYSRPRRPYSATNCKQEPRLSGTLIQPWLVAGWSEDQWKAELRSMKEACVKQLIIQWVADSKEKSTFYPSGLSDYKQSSTTDILNASGSKSMRAGGRKCLRIFCPRAQ
jgi:hypothetical protein